MATTRERERERTRRMCTVINGDAGGLSIQFFSISKNQHGGLHRENIDENIILKQKMGRTIIVEEKVGDYISSLYGNYQWQLGIIIGQVSFFWFHCPWLIEVERYPVLNPLTPFLCFFFSCCVFLPLSSC